MKEEIRTIPMTTLIKENHTYLDAEKQLKHEDKEKEWYLER